MANATYTLNWDQTGEHYVESGVDHVVLYTPKTTGQTTDPYGTATAWNGVTGITQKPSGGEANDVYADNIKYISLRSAEKYGSSITAYQSPAEFDACDGSIDAVPGVKIGQQARLPFGLSYRTFIGDDVKGQEGAYKIHLAYGLTASPSERQYATINDSPSPIELSWELESNGILVPNTNYKPISHIEIDSRTVDATKLAAFLIILYGDETSDGKLPLPNEVITAFT